MTQENLSPKARRERGLNDLADAIEILWGPRCSRHEGSCHCCIAWSVFDLMEKLTDSSCLKDDATDSTQPQPPQHQPRAEEQPDGEHE